MNPIFPPPPANLQIAEMKLTLWDREDNDQIIELTIDDNGGGHFPVVAPIGNSTFVLDPDQMVAFAEWVRALCHWVDAQEKNP